MLVCRNCKKIIMYSVNGYCEECITPERAAQQSVQPTIESVGSAPAVVVESKVASPAESG